MPSTSRESRLEEPAKILRRTIRKKDKVILRLFKRQALAFGELGKLLWDSEPCVWFRCETLALAKLGVPA